MDSYYASLTVPAKWVQADAAERMVPIDLTSYLNNVGVTSEPNLANGELNIWRNSYPLDEVRALGEEIDVGGIRFAMPSVDGVGPDSIRCSGQHIQLPTNRFDWIYLLCSSERRVEDEAALHFASGDVDFIPFCVSDFWPGAMGRSGEPEAVRFSALNFPRHRQERIEPAIWRQRLPVARETPLSALRLPNNVAAHVFAITCLLSER